MKTGYLVIDIGTGNTRAGVFLSTGESISINSVDTEYFTDRLYSDSVYFNPQLMWNDILKVSKMSIDDALDVHIKGVVSTSCREGIVLIDKHGNSFLGLPNIDNRGAEFEGKIGDESKVYSITGRWPCRYFSAYKLYGLKEKRNDEFSKIDQFTSISDWVGYMFTGNIAYEPSQACETLLFDTKNSVWSGELCDLYGISMSILPQVLYSGERLGNIKEEIADQLGLKKRTAFIVGGADTQIALKGMNALPGQIVVTSGTTTPITMITDNYIIDKKQRCWINNYLDKNIFVIETNVGVTGLNYQRLKKVFFPNVSYSEIESEMEYIKYPKCLCSLSTMEFEKNQSFNTGAFVISTPADAALGPADFAYAVLLDIAFGIKSNIDVMEDISRNTAKEVIGCGGGFNGNVFPQLVADILGKEVALKENYNQSSIMGGVRICNKYFKTNMNEINETKRFLPQNNEVLMELYKKWRKIRYTINNEI